MPETPKILIWSLLFGILVLLIALGIMSFFAINNAFSLSYLEDSQESILRSHDALIRVVELDWQGISKANLIEKLTAAQSNSELPAQIIKTDDQRNSIWYGQIEFQFDGDNLIALNK